MPLTTLRLIGAVALLAVPMACAHTRSVGTTPSEAKDDRPAGTDADSVSPRPAKSATHHHESDASSKGVPIAMSPVGLLKPSAVESIQQKLQSEGHLSSGHVSGKLDGATTEALRAFQRDHGLPSTGTPDDATVQKLGLQPGDVFRASSP